MGKLVATAACAMETVTMTEEVFCGGILMTYFTSRNLKHETFQINQTTY